MIFASLAAGALSGAVNGALGSLGVQPGTSGPSPNPSCAPATGSFGHDLQSLMARLHIHRVGGSPGSTDPSSAASPLQSSSAGASRAGSDLLSLFGIGSGAGATSDAVTGAQQAAQAYAASAAGFG